MMQIAFRLKTNCTLTKFTAENPSLTVLDWCNFDVEFYELRTANPSELDTALESFLEIRRKLGFTLQKKETIGDDSVMLVMKCKHARRGSIVKSMQKYSCLALFPVLMHQGWLWITGICFDESKITAMFTRLSKFGELKLDGKTKLNRDPLRNSPMIPASTLMSDLTARQAEALLVAVDQGYYHVPRKARFEDISKTVGVPRTTYEEHVRKAESKIINASAPYLSMYFGRSRACRKSLDGSNLWNIQLENRIFTKE
jgi:predicted DNA binding protein